MASRGWQTHNTGDLIAKGLLSIGDGYRAKNSELSEQGRPFARAGNIDGGFRFDGADRFPEADLDKVGDKMSRPGDSVFTSKGTVGRFAYVDEDVEPFVYSPQLCFWRSHSNGLIYPRFLFYWMQGGEFWRQVAGLKGQTDMADYVSLRDQRNLKITLPPPAEQRAIAAILGALDDKIELNRRMNETLEGIARALFQSWFVDFDPVRARARGEAPPGMDEATAALFPDGFEEVEGREVPRGWEVKPLDEIANYQNGLALQKYPPEGDEFLRVVKIRELRQGFTDDSSGKANPDIRPDCIIDNGDVVFSWSGSLLVDIWCGGKSALNQHLFKVTSDVYPRWFYYFWTLHHLGEFQRIAGYKATTMGHIRRHHLSEAMTNVPPENVMLAAHELIGPLVDLMVEHNLQSQTVASLRDTLLPKLISGELRVAEEGTETEVVV